MVMPQSKPLLLYNSLTKQKDEFTPSNPEKVNFYICGPTVYDSAHMGHARAYLSFDIVRRVLVDYFKYNLYFVMNITDIDDKIIKRARQNHLFELYYDKNKNNFEQVGKDLEPALVLLKNKAKDEADPEKSQMLLQMAKDANTIVQNVENKLKEAEPTAELYAEVTEVMLSSTKDILSEWLDRQLGHTVNDHLVFSSLAKKFELEFFEDMKLLGVMNPDRITRVSEFMNEIREYVQRILDNGYAYVTADGSVYFDTVKFRSAENHSYPKLVRDAYDDSANQAKHMKESEGELSIGGEQQQEKKNPADFALWKASKSGEPFWPSPWGNGRPGWHIECSAMSTSVCGAKLDIHAGGQDLRFPHHDNEIAQCEAYLETDNWVNYFLHCGTLRIAGSKMSKSLKNFISIRGALKSHTTRQIRLLFLMQNWKDDLDFSSQTMEHTCQFEKITKDFFLLAEDVLRGKDLTEQPLGELELEAKEKLEEAKRAIHDALCDSIDTHTVIETLRSVVNLGNGYITATETNGSTDYCFLLSITQLITDMLNIFGVIPKHDSIGYPLEFSGEELMEMYKASLDVLTAFCDDVRKLAVEKDNADIVVRCDKFKSDTAHFHDVVVTTCEVLKGYIPPCEDGVTGTSGSKVKELLLPPLIELAALRWDVRNLARAHKNKEVLFRCDKLRDTDLPKNNIRFEDRLERTCIKLDKPDLEAELRKKAAEEAKLAAKKAAEEAKLAAKKKREEAAAKKKLKKMEATATKA